MSVMFNILAPVMLITAIGYILGRMSIGLQSRTLGNLVILVATPSLVFHTNVTADIGKESLSDLLMAAALCLTISGLIAFMALKLAGSSPQSYLPSLMFPNSGNLGLPLVVLAFGTLGTQMGISYFVVVALIQHSLGLAIASGGFRIGELARQPLVYSVALVLLVMVTGMEVPQVILTTTKMLGDMMIPAMLILLGISLATLKVTDLKVAAALAVARLVIGLISAIAVIKLLDLSGVSAGVVFLMATMPSAIVTYVYAERYDQNANKVAGAVVASTLLTFACLPILLWGAMYFSGGPASATVPGMVEALQ